MLLPQLIQPQFQLLSAGLFIDVDGAADSLHRMSYIYASPHAIACYDQTSIRLKLQFFIC